MNKIKYHDGEYVKVYWTDSILKIRYDFGKPEQIDRDNDIWYGCEKSEYSPTESGYYCNMAQNDVVGMATKEEFLKSRKKSFEFWLERFRETVRYYENEIEKINKLLG